MERLRRENKKKASVAELRKLKKQVGAEDGGSTGGQVGALMPGKDKGQGGGRSVQEMLRLQKELARLEQRLEEHGEYFEAIVPNSPPVVQDEIERKFRERKKKEESMRSLEFQGVRRELYGELEAPVAKSWTVDEVVVWFQGLVLTPFKLPSIVISNCYEYNINGASLLMLDHESLKDLGIEKSLLRTKLLGLISDL